MNLKIIDRAKCWCVKKSILHGFPTPPLKEHHAPKKYCKNYPCLYIHDLSLDSIEFKESLKERNLEAKKLFSLSNPKLIISAIFNQIFIFCYLLTSFFSFIFVFTNQRIFLEFGFLFLLLSLYLHFLSKIIIKELLRNNYEITCILEAFYICLELSANNILTNKELRDSLVRRIKNLSKLIYLDGQQKKYSKDTLKQHYSRISLDILDKINWVYSAQHSTMLDLRKYFKNVTYCLVIGKIGEIKVDQSSSKLQNSQRDWNKLISKTEQTIEKTMTFSERIFVWIKNVISFLSTLKRAILPFF